MFDMQRRHYAYLKSINQGFLSRRRVVSKIEFFRMKIKTKEGELIASMHFLKSSISCVNKLWERTLE